MAGAEAVLETRIKEFTDGVNTAVRTLGAVPLPRSIPAHQPTNRSPISGGGQDDPRRGGQDPGGRPQPRPRGDRVH